MSYTRRHTPRARGTLLQLGRGSGEVGLPDFISWMEQNHPELLESGPEADWDALQEQARSWLEDRYRNDWVTSNTDENYYDYWGGYWDSVNGS